jgi:hypothetical protein
MDVRAISFKDAENIHMHVGLITVSTFRRSVYICKNYWLLRFPFNISPKSPFSMGLLFGTEKVFSWVQVGKRRGFTEWMPN